MKDRSRLRISWAGLAIVLAIFAVSTFGQSPDAMRIRLPFEATAGRATLPAGDYLVRLLPSDDNACVLEFSSETGHVAVLAAAVQISTADNAPAKQSETLLFHIGNKYTIAKVFMQGRNLGYELLPVLPSE